MTAPSTTALTLPAGIPLVDGFTTAYAFALDPDVSLWEKSAKPPGLDGGDPIDTTTMRNTLYRTVRARQLISLTEATGSGAYDPDVYNNILSNLINQEGSITAHFSDGSTLDFYGYLRTFDPQDHSEGEQPTANYAIQPTNWDPVAHAEAGPVLTSVAGT